MEGPQSLQQLKFSAAEQAEAWPQRVEVQEAAEGVQTTLTVLWFSKTLTKKRGERERVKSRREETIQGEERPFYVVGKRKDPAEKRVSRFGKAKELEMEQGILRNTFLDLFFGKQRKDLLNTISQRFQNL